MGVRTIRPPSRSGVGKSAERRSGKLRTEKICASANENQGDPRYRSPVRRQILAPSERGGPDEDVRILARASDRRDLGDRAPRGIVVGSYGPLDHSELDEKFLEAFDYSPGRSAFIEAHRDAFDLYDPVRG
jgi:hypothetical protein